VPGIVGLLMIQSWVTGFCPVYWTLDRLGMKEQAPADSPFKASPDRRPPRRPPAGMTPLLYAGIARDLRARGQLIGANDLWIGASSLRFQLPIVTANEEHFRRIDGLEVLGYRDGAAG
jgi:hypothetical protein